MSDIMRPMPFGQLMTWALDEYKALGTVFGVPKGPAYTGTRPIFAEQVEVPLGPAAGPHTQLAQNIIAAYVAGARFFELKTVQIMDGEELSRCVPKPCITAGDEGYNCEWSTELTVPQAFDEYVKAWFACKLLSKELDLGPADGFVFNMSVGYDLAGVKSPKIDRYITEMMDAGGTESFQSCRDWAKRHLDRFQKVGASFVEAVPAAISRSITESTLHGCPPAEIEGIASRLIAEKGLHTYVKCNPTLLGYDYARQTLDRLGYAYLAFDDHHFREDLQWADAVPMFRRLSALAAEKGVEFGVKLTNTFPVDVKAGELPSGEMYMSGRALFPLSLSLAEKISREFDGKLRISYSGGADLHSVKALASAGIWPITVATTLLKPGGYRRLSQLGEACAAAFHHGGDASGIAAEAAAGTSIGTGTGIAAETAAGTSIGTGTGIAAETAAGTSIGTGTGIAEEAEPPAGAKLINATGTEENSPVNAEATAWSGVDTEAVSTLLQNALKDPYYRKPLKPLPDRKNGKAVPLTDCFTAPCRGGCPIGQDIPAYLRLVRAGRYAEALAVILERNPLPFITGTLCPHPCAEKCTRAFYEEAVHIREAKLAAAESGYADVFPSLAPPPKREGVKAAIVGGGPAGMACAFFLAREGVPVTIYEATGRLGGVVRHIIPDFRITDAEIDLDASFLDALGVTVKLNSPVKSYKELKKYTHVVFATGAQRHGELRLEYAGEADKRLNFTEVLSALRRGVALDLGTDVAVVGAGNSAMDTARALRRLPGVEHVRLVYRRTVREMPGEERELSLALEEGVEFLELLSPAGVKDGSLTCHVMEPGEPGPDGRRGVSDTGRTVTLPCTALIAAVGERVDEASPDVGPWPAIGDRKCGPATVVEAIRDAAAAAKDILDSLDAGKTPKKGVMGLLGKKPDGAKQTEPEAAAPGGQGGYNYEKVAGLNGAGDRAEAEALKGRLCADCADCGAGERCLECATVCELCADVCPNRANIAVNVPGLVLPQIVHVDGMCNECGNCAVFCPYDSAPYRDKLTLFWTREDFENSANQGWLPMDGGRVLLRLDGAVRELDLDDSGADGVDSSVLAVMRAVRLGYPWLAARE